MRRSFKIFSQKNPHNGGFFLNFKVFKIRLLHRVSRLILIDSFYLGGK